MTYPPAAPPAAEVATALRNVRAFATCFCIRAAEAASARCCAGLRVVGAMYVFAAFDCAAFACAGVAFFTGRLDADPPVPPVAAPPARAADPAPVVPRPPSPSCPPRAMTSPLSTVMWGKSTRHGGDGWGDTPGHSVSKSSASQMGQDLAVANGLVMDAPAAPYQPMTVMRDRSSRPAGRITTGTSRVHAHHDCRLQQGRCHVLDGHLEIRCHLPQPVLHHSFHHHDHPGSPSPESPRPTTPASTSPPPQRPPAPDHAPPATQPHSSAADQPCTSS